MLRHYYPLILVACATANAWAAPIDETSPPEDSPSSESSPDDRLYFWRSIEGRFGGPTSGTANGQIDLARQSLLAGDVDKSLQYLKEAVVADPTLPPEVLMLAYLYMANNNWQNGKIALEQAVKHHRDHPEVYQACGQVALAEGRIADAWVHLAQAQRMAPPSAWNKEKRRDFQSRCFAGIVAVSEQWEDWEMAAKMFGRWEAAVPLDANALGRWGKAQLFSGNKEAALELLSRAHQLDPSMNPPEIAMAALYTEKGMYDEAEATYQMAAKKYPNDSRVWFEFAGSRLLAGNSGEAREYLEKAAKIGSHAEKLRIELPLLSGLVARSEKRYQDAEGYFTDVLKLSPGHPVALMQLPLVLVETDDSSAHQRALQMAMIYAQKHPNSPQALTSLGWVQYRLGQQKEAEAALGKAVMLSGNNSDGETLFFLAQSMLANGKAQQAEPYVQMLRAAVQGHQLFILRDDARKWLDSVALAFGN